MRKSIYSVKRTGSAIPAVPELYKIPWILIYCFCMIVLHLQWIQRLGIMLALSLIMLTFLNIVRQWRGLKTWSVCAQQPWYTLPHPPEVCTLEATIMRISPYYRHTAEVTTGFTLEGFHCQRLCVFFVICVVNLQSCGVSFLWCLFATLLDELKASISQNILSCTWNNLSVNRHLFACSHLTYMCTQTRPYFTHLLNIIQLQEHRTLLESLSKCIHFKVCTISLQEYAP